MILFKAFYKLYCPGGTMADIKSYFKEKAKREQRQTDYKEKILRHRLVSVYRVLLVAACAAALIALMAVQYKRHVYTDYDVISTVPRESAQGAIDVRLGNSILTYSKDGAHCTNAQGETTWNQTYQIQDIRLALSGDTAAIGDYNGRNIYVQNSSGQLGTITTAMPVRDLTVSASGRVTAVLADTDTAWINTYDASGELFYHGQAHMDSAGYPGAISLSPNGELLSVAYVYVDAGVLKTKVAFYNFADVGESYLDFIVSSWSYTDMIVPMIRFMNDSTAFAVGDSRLMIYTGSRKPTVAAEYLFDEEVQSVFYSDTYVGLVFRSEDSGHLYCLNVYNTAGDEVGRYDLDMEYSDIFFGQENFVAYNETECMIMTMDGIVKYNGTFHKPVRLMLPAGNTYKYTLVTEDSIDTIQLK